jgi:hypothetical protein
MSEDLTVPPLHWGFNRPQPARAFSKIFTCDVVERWPWPRGHSVTVADFIAAARANDDFAYRLLRAAGTNNPNVHNPSSRDVKAVLIWLRFFLNGPALPTHDGEDDAVILTVSLHEDTFCLFRRSDVQDPNAEQQVA